MSSHCVIATNVLPTKKLVLFSHWVSNKVSQWQKDRMPLLSTDMFNNLIPSTTLSKLTLSRNRLRNIFLTFVQLVSLYDYDTSVYISLLYNATSICSCIFDNGSVFSLLI